MKRIGEWVRDIRFAVAGLVMDRRDKETLEELRNITRVMVEKLGWDFINDLQQKDTYVVIEEEQQRIH